MKLIPVFIDLETFWGKDHSLSKMNPISYCVHPDTEIISCAAKVGDEPTYVTFGEAAIKKQTKAFDWSDKIVVGHNLSLFDSMILRWRLGVRPAMWGCTLAMSRPLHGLTVGGSLAALVEHYGIGKKDQTALVNTKGRHLEDFTPEEIEAMREYNRMDVEYCAALFKILLPLTPKKEMRIIDGTIRMLVEPKFRIDAPLLEAALVEERGRKRLMLLDTATMIGANVVGKTDDEIADDVSKMLGSAQKFAKLLKDLGVEPPMKPSPTNPEKQTFALAKTDEAFTALLIELGVPGQYLQCHRPAERLLHRFENDAHSPAAQFADNAEIAETIEDSVREPEIVEAEPDAEPGSPGPAKLVLPPLLRAGDRHRQDGVGEHHRHPRCVAPGDGDAQPADRPSTHADQRPARLREVLHDRR